MWPGKLLNPKSVCPVLGSRRRRRTDFACHAKTCRQTGGKQEIRWAGRWNFLQQGTTTKHGCPLTQSPLTFGSALSAQPGRRAHVYAFKQASELLPPGESLQGAAAIGTDGLSISPACP